jgi:hypothetical protein
MKCNCLDGLELAHGLDNRLSPVRLGQEHTSSRHLVRLRFALAGRDDDVDRGPAIPHSGGQFQTVHRAAGHIDVGENATDLVLLQQRDGLVGVARGEDIITGVFQFVRDDQTDEGLIFDDQDSVQLPFQSMPRECVTTG